MKLLINVLTLLLVALTDAQKVGVKSHIGYACVQGALTWGFSCPKVVLPLDCRCRSKEFLVTAMQCVESHSNDVKETYDGWHYIRDQCHYWGNYTVSIHDMEEVYRKVLPTIVDASDYNETNPFPVRIPEKLFEKEMVGTKNTKYHYNVGNYFAWGIIGYWGFIMTGAIILNAIRVLNPNIYNIFGHNRVTGIRKFFTLPALFGTSHHHPIRLFRFFALHLATRGQSLIILGFIGINIASIVSFLGVQGETPVGFLSKQDRVLHYLANRTGIIAFGHMPLLVLFACRNNPFIYLTSWPYDTFMTYHRWCARWMGIHAVIHSVAIYWSSIEEKVVIYKWNHVHNWRGGNLATYMAIFMLTLGLRSFRARFYEFFKATHVIMFLIFIICLLVHVSDYGWMAWLYTSLAFYGMEYTARLAKIIMSGGIQKAHFHQVAPDMYRITVPGGRRKWNIKPGNYVYIRVLTKDLFLQAHPFSIFQSYTSEKDDSLDLCCKAQLGATRKILQKLIADPDKSFDCKVTIEGPYGMENYVCQYDSIFLFTGGVGFTAMHTYATNILKRMKPGQYLNIVWVVKDCYHLNAFEEEVAYLVRNTGNNSKFRIFVTKPDQLELGTVAYANDGTPIEPKKPMMLDTKTVVEKKASVNKDALTSQVTLVGSAPPTPSNNTPQQPPQTTETTVSEDGDSNDYMMNACHIIVEGTTVVNIDYGRPNISAEVSDFVRIANGSKAIVSCGPPMFVDMIRDGIVKSILDSEARVDYFEDAFSW